MRHCVSTGTFTDGFQQKDHVEASVRVKRIEDCDCRTDVLQRAIDYLVPDSVLDYLEGSH